MDNIFLINKSIGRKVRFSLTLNLVEIDVPVNQFPIQKFLMSFKFFKLKVLEMYPHITKGSMWDGITCSQRGVLKTLCLPNRSASPVVHRKTPPKPTSSPNT